MITYKYLTSENILGSENKNCIHTPTFAYGNSDEDNTLVSRIRGTCMI